MKEHSSDSAKAQAGSGSSGKIDLTRRKFLRSTAAAGATVAMTRRNVNAQEPSDLLRVAIVGCGAQGQALLNASEKAEATSGFRFVAVCDIWEYHRNQVARRLRKRYALSKTGWTVNDYERIEDMLET